MEAPLVCDDQDWPYVLTLLPSDLEESAKDSRALVRCRNIPNAAALVRMVLAYALSDLSLKDVAGWAGALNLATITGPGFFYRVREAEAWLERVLAQTLAHEVRRGPTGLRLRAVDATVINGPGAKGTEWRAHVLIDPGTGGFRTVELTDSRGGEKYSRYPIAAREVVLGDRAYATARGIHAVRSAGAHVLVRLNPHSLRICTPDRERYDLLKEKPRVPKTGAMEFDLVVPIPPEKRTVSHKPWDISTAIDWIPVRVVAARTRDEEIIWILTTLSPADVPSSTILELYRLRWQIELLFKRLKSLLHLDALPSRQGPTAKSWMLARFLAAALAQRLAQPSGPLSPWGYELPQAGLHP